MISWQCYVFSTHNKSRCKFHFRVVSSKDASYLIFKFWHLGQSNSTKGDCCYRMDTVLGTEGLDSMGDTVPELNELTAQWGDWHHQGDRARTATKSKYRIRHCYDDMGRCHALFRYPQHSRKPCGQHPHSVHPPHGLPGSSHLLKCAPCGSLSFTPPLHIVTPASSLNFSHCLCLSVLLSPEMQWSDCPPPTASLLVVQTTIRKMTMLLPVDSLYPFTWTARPGSASTT